MQPHQRVEHVIMRFMKWLTLAMIALLPSMTLWENLAAQNAGDKTIGKKEVPVADDGPQVYQGARIHTAAGAPVERGVLVVQRGKILAVGPEGMTPIPEDARVVRAIA